MLMLPVGLVGVWINSRRSIELEIEGDGLALVVRMLLQRWIG